MDFSKTTSLIATKHISRTNEKAGFVARLSCFVELPSTAGHVHAPRFVILDRFGEKNSRATVPAIESCTMLAEDRRAFSTVFRRFPKIATQTKCKCGAEVTVLNVGSFAGLGVGYVL